MLIRESCCTEDIPPQKNRRKTDWTTLLIFSKRDKNSLTRKGLGSDYPAHPDSARTHESIKTSRSFSNSCFWSQQEVSIQKKSHKYSSTDWNIVGLQFASSHQEKNSNNSSTGHIKYLGLTLVQEALLP